MPIEGLSITLNSRCPANNQTYHNNENQNVYYHGHLDHSWCAPPELYSNIVHNGIWMAGGGSLLRGIAKWFTDKVNIPFCVAKDPLKAVARGTCLALKGTEQYPFLMK